MKTSQIPQIQIDAYNYALPNERIAKYPLAKRDTSKLLVYKPAEITDAMFLDLPNYLPSDSLLVFNNTKVIQARMHFRKDTGAIIEIFCLEPHLPNDYLLNFQQTRKCSWICLIGNLRKWKAGKLSLSFDVDNKTITLDATRMGILGEAHLIEFEWNEQSISFAEVLEAVGELPIPPYLDRDTEEEDIISYQTVYSKIKGSVAAPTAGLHFTDTIFESLKNNGFKTSEVTLHVGAGTFRPVKSNEIKNHTMHSEFISVHKEFIENILAHKGKVVAVGTTSVRTLESLYYIGEALANNTVNQLTVTQWQAYFPDSNKITTSKALQNIIAYLDKHKQDTLIADTQIMIAPGYKFKIVDAIITNFHQPQSTLLLLVSAFVGENNWERIYKHALANNYRFLSYGDSSLLLKD